MTAGAKAQQAKARARRALLCEIEAEGRSPAAELHLSYQRVSQMRKEARLEMAGLVAEGVSISIAGLALGMSCRAAAHVWADICRIQGEEP